MKPILGTASGWQRVKALGRRGVVVLALCLGVGIAQADTTNFVGDFAAAFWTNEVQFGSIVFSNSNTELVLAGPNAPSEERNSLDGIVYNGPLPGGLTVGGTIQFNWSYDSGDALSTSEADFAWTPPGGSPNPLLLYNGGPGVVQSGTFPATAMPAGTTFEFLLSTDTLPNKTSATLLITGFQFIPDVPEPSTGALLASMLTGLGAARWRRSRRVASARP